MPCSFFVYTNYHNHLVARTGIHRHQGVGLLEVLVALLVLSIGVLGALTLQLKALRYTASAAYTTQASFIAYDMLERMRANSTALNNYVIHVDPGCNARHAATSVLATDLQDFIHAVSCQLPEGYGNIAIDGHYATVTIGWSEARIVAGEQSELVTGSTVLAPPS